MLNRKSNDAPACAGIGAAQRASPRISPEIRNDRCFILTSLHERTRFVNSKRDTTSRGEQARRAKALSLNQLVFPVTTPAPAPGAGDRLDLSSRVDGYRMGGRGEQPIAQARRRAPRPLQIWLVRRAGGAASATGWLGAVRCA